jgi:hypothetical protein
MVDVLATHKKYPHRVHPFPSCIMSTNQNVEFAIYTIA